jgi:DNA-binding NarL/FixJ family response regulator
MNTGSESPKRSNPGAGALTRRRYLAGLRPLGSGEWSSWMEHGNKGWYVPLGTRDETAATGAAETLRRQLATQGWEKAGVRMVREFTLAVFWSESPLACTYTTVFSLAGTAGLGTAAAAGTRSLRMRLAVIVSDPVFRAAIVHWIEQIPGCTATGFGSLAELADAPRRSARVDVVLVNRDDATVTTETLPARMREGGAPLVYPVGVYPTSDHIFMSFNGVESGYLLRRRPLPQLLEPLDGAFASGRLVADEASRAIRRYCQGMFSPAAGQMDASVRSALTLRERQILTCLQRGLHDKEIAGELGISPLTVHTHLKHIFEKLGAHTRTEAVVKYLEK